MNVSIANCINQGGLAGVEISSYHYISTPFGIVDIAPGGCLHEVIGESIVL
jgi:hypothetical protein